jgi:hypothetical protein
MMTMAAILIIALATWRIAAMLADEDEKGPAELLVKLRVWALRLNANLHEGLTCYKCNSVWIGAAFAALYLANASIAFFIAFPFALSAIAVLLEDYVRRD